MSTSRQEGGSPDRNEFPALDSESGAPPPLQIVSQPSSPWQHQMAFDFESYRDCSSDYIPTNICSTWSSPEGDGEGLALSPLWKFSDVSYASVPHPNAPNRFSTYPLSNSVLSLTVTIFTWQDLTMMKCVMKRSCQIISCYYENECLVSSERRSEELVELVEFSLQDLVHTGFAEDFDICQIPEAKEILRAIRDSDAQAAVALGKQVRNFKVIMNVEKETKRVEDFRIRKMLKVFELLGEVFSGVQLVKELKRDKSKRRCGKTAKSVSIEHLEEAPDRNGNVAAKSLGDSLSYGIPQWPPGKGNEDELSVSELELKGKNLSVGVPEVAFNQTSLISNPLYDMVGPLTVPTNLNSCGQQNSFVSHPKTICQSATYSVHPPVSMQLGTPIKQIPEFIHSDAQCSNLHLELLVTADIPPSQTTVQGVGSIQEVKELQRDKSKRKWGKNEKLISLEDLEELSDRTLKDAAKICEVSKSTLKRIRKSYGIPRWPPVKRNKEERIMSESELKGKSLCVGVPEVAFNQTSTSNPLSDMVGPSTMPTSLNSCSQQNSLAYDPTTICQSATYSVHAPVSMQLGLPIEQIPKLIQSDPQCSNLHLEQLAAADIPAPQTTVQGVESITVKATFGEDLIKFDLLSSSQMVNLEEKVAKQLNLKQGNFKLKYMDEENEWVFIACDEALKTCIDTMSSLGKTTIRMLVQPINH